MINSLKTIAVFGSNFTGIYRYPLTKAFDKAAGEIGMNLVYINYIGRVGTSYVQYGEYEFDLLKNIEIREIGDLREPHRSDIDPARRLPRQPHLPRCLPLPPSARHR